MLIADIRSSGGWELVIAGRKDKHFRKSDEHILGDDKFVSQALIETKEQQYNLKNKSIDVDTVSAIF